MTTATETARTCPPSAVVDQIVPWGDVREGELLLWDGDFCLVTRKGDYDGLLMFWLDGDERFPHGVFPCGTYAAVRRYQEG